MGLLGLLLVLAADDPGEPLSKKLLPVYQKEAAEYSLAVESAPGKPLDLKKEPVFEWSNPARGGGQQGAVFVWLRDGRPAALGCIFSEPYPNLPGGRKVMHEFHALDAEKLVVRREGANRWEPQAGLARTELADAGAPADAPATRLLQMRRLAQEFAGHAVDREGKRWDLRLLPAPLHRYPAAKTGVVDGALFALVSNAGTDPEVLLLVEAREDAGKRRWEFACGRFSDWSLYMYRKDKEVWAAARDAANPYAHNSKHTYRIYEDKVVTPEGKVLAHIRQAGKKPELIPAQEK